MIDHQSLAKLQAISKSIGDSQAKQAADRQDELRRRRYHSEGLTPGEIDFACNAKIPGVEPLIDDQQNALEAATLSASLSPGEQEYLAALVIPK